MFISSEFEYNNISSNTMKVSLISVEQGMMQVPFGYKRNVIEEKVLNRDTPYFYGFEKECLTLKITIGKINENDGLAWTFSERKKIVEWFYQNDYCPFVSADNPEVIYYCTPIEDNIRYDNGLLQGYVQITLKCNSPFAYTPTYIKEYDYQKVTNNIIEIENLSNVKDYYYPEIQFQAFQSDVKIINLTDGGREFLFTNLESNEKIYVNNQMKMIKSDKTDVMGNKIYRLSNFNKQWFRLVKGINRIQIIGNVNILFKYTYPISI